MKQARFQPLRAWHWSRSMLQWRNTRNRPGRWQQTVAARNRQTIRWQRCASTSMPSTRVTRRRWRRLSLSRGRSWTGWPRTFGRGRPATEDWYRDVLIEGKQHWRFGLFHRFGRAAAQRRHRDQRLCGGSRDHDVQITEAQQVMQSGAVFTVALRQSRRRVAHSSMGLGEGYCAILINAFVVAHSDRGPRTTNASKFGEMSCLNSMISSTSSRRGCPHSRAATNFSHFASLPRDGLG